MKRYSILALLLFFWLSNLAHAGRVHLIGGESLTAVMSGAAATTNPTTLVDWSEGGSTNTPSGSLSGATAVTLLSTPAGVAIRVVNAVEVYNADTAAVTVTLARVSGGTSYTLAKTTLQAGDTFTLNQDGIRVTDTSGQVKQSASSAAIVPVAVNPSDWRVHDAVATNLPATAATDDLGLIAGTDGTAFASLRTADFKATTASNLARCWIALPDNYVAGSAITIRVRGGMITTVSDGTATVDLSVYSNDGDATGSAELCTTDAVSINSLTFANKDFTITPTGLVAGQLLNVKLTVAGSDTATATAVIGAVAAVELRTSVSQ